MLREMLWLLLLLLLCRLRLLLAAADDIRRAGDGCRCEGGSRSGIEIIKKKFYNFMDNLNLFCKITITLFNMALI